MNQKLFYTKHNKMEQSQEILLSSRNRVRSVFQDVSNMNFTFQNKLDKCSKNQKEETKSQNSRRRNAIIPVQIERMLKQIENAEFQFQFMNFQVRSGNEIEKDILCYFDKFRCEIQQYELVIEQKSNKLNIDKHDFSDEQLERVLDWMVYKMKKFKKVSNESIFKAIELVYQYLQNTSHLTYKELELISGCSIYISSKFVDLYPIYIDDLSYEVLQQKYYNSDILQQERKICQSLNYNLCFTTSLQLVHRILMDLKDLIEQIYDKEKMDLLIQKIIENLFYMEIGQEFRQISKCNKALACILLTLIEENVESRVVIISILFNVLSCVVLCESFQIEYKLD
ncbi:unnamed protein product [Paramecium sonneborni]|uniref:Cyclin N-terminal domain-containing protein n=1 Tax=Paramecium sonneborni TaxID=65129 RepID=A0A8S1P7S4_9CILI|nr:unnamed protein product [Paramecium sonneborni]